MFLLVTEGEEEETVFFACDRRNEFGGVSAWHMPKADQR